MTKRLALLIFLAVLSITLIFFSVRNTGKSATKKTVAVEEKTPITEYKEHLSPLDYNSILGKTNYNSTPLEILELGYLKLSTGLIVVEDPLVMLSAEPFIKPVKPGNYPVSVVVAKTKDSGDRYALAQLRFSDKKAEKWVLALKKNDDTTDLKPDEYLGFSVDAGLACFADHPAANEYLRFNDKFNEDHPDENMYDDLLAAEFKKNAQNKDDPQDVGDWVNFKIPNSAKNIILFHSGDGDGVYPCYWGVTKAGEVVSLVIDSLY